MNTPFVSTEWLAEHLRDPSLVVVDGSWYLPTEQRDPGAEYAAGHIPGAVFFDIDAIADTSTGLPHMLLPPQDFARAVGAMGIAERMTIVVYDEAGLFSAPRVRWTFLVMGAPDVRLLEGGGPKWRAEGRPLQSGVVQRPPVTFTPLYDGREVADLGLMREVVETGGCQVVDARPGPRFRGEAPEPRPNTRTGHMPGARSMPALAVTENGILKSPEVIRAQAAAAGVDLSKPIITTCGSGVTAATVKLALEQAGAKDVRLYDGSWAEWGGRSDTPVVTD